VFPHLKTCFKKVVEEIDECLENHNFEGAVKEIKEFEEVNRTMN
jgi:hypothetical protein